MPDLGAVYSHIAVARPLRIYPTPLRACTTPTLVTRRPLVLYGSLTKVEGHTADALPKAVTVTVHETSSAAARPLVYSTASAASASTTTTTSQIGGFGTCSVLEIEFDTGFDGRKETSFQPVNQTSYDHWHQLLLTLSSQWSAQNVAIITQFMCDALTNTCGANELAKTTCPSAAAAASSAPSGSGAQADAFNAVFGITTDFASVPETTSASATANTTAFAASTSSTSAVAQIGDFCSCSVAEIEFGDGFDGCTEASFRPADLSSYNHGSADGIAVITSFICQQVDDACGANNLAKTTCQTAASAASSAAIGTGAQADAFNAVFGIATDFAAVPEINDQGQTVTATATASA
ncbi:uncharacterized protein LAESUDRAFT_716378 [Laetiporus sulphureus 93-53]|uniref:Uncharacterized protein n=1 Tax=Laetiporus sulphureus 93-53 TaxID=1314785 RepID=A0A165CPQ7_9APHY|nr:uncharacterized protein LAESUDRAFT_716378 [Laetiporus sulphureus 93-53]KZT03195.1 hypothetical protein LAESUDRAFT_716378 [Laetiporus sulphureus 93-53]